MDPTRAWRRYGEAFLLRQRFLTARLSRYYARMRCWRVNDGLAEVQASLAAALPELTAAAVAELARECEVERYVDEVLQYRLQLMPRRGLLAEIADMEVRCSPQVQEIQRAGRPVIYVSAHYGSFMQGALKAALDFPARRLNFFYNPTERNAYASTSDALLGLANESCGLLHNTPQGIMAAARCLRRGESLCIIADQLTAEGEIVFVPFFARFYGAMQGVAYFARLADAVILPLFARTRRDGRCVLEFHEPIFPTDFANFDPTLQMYQLTCSVFRAMEKQIRAYPTHWRYWGSYGRYSLKQPRPPTDVADSRRQLLTLRAMLAYDVSLCDSDIWNTLSQSLDAGGEGCDALIKKD